VPKTVKGRSGMARKPHADAGIERALQYAEKRGWRVEKAQARAHCWGKMYCPHNDPDCRGGVYCIASIWSTPRSGENHARQIRRVVDGCIWTPEKED
jgi:hypothetical protein